MNQRATKATSSTASASAPAATASRIISAKSGALSDIFQAIPSLLRAGGRTLHIPPASPIERADDVRFSLRRPHGSNVVQGGVAMGEKILQHPLLTAAGAVDQAADWARDLTLMESRGPGDMENAWERLEARYAVPSALFRALRYRRPKEIAAHMLMRLEAARRAETERRLRAQEHNRDIERLLRRRGET